MGPGTSRTGCARCHVARLWRVRRVGRRPGLAYRLLATAITTVACFGVGLVTSEVLFGWATEEDFQPNIDGLSRDEVLLSSVLTTAVVVLVMRHLGHRAEDPKSRGARHVIGRHFGRRPATREPPRPRTSHRVPEVRRARRTQHSNRARTLIGYLRLDGRSRSGQARSRCPAGRSGTGCPRLRWRGSPRGLCSAGRRGRSGSRGVCSARSGTALLTDRCFGSRAREVVMSEVVIGVDPHKGSVTIEVVDPRWGCRCDGTVPRDRGGYRPMMAFCSPVAVSGLGCRRRRGAGGPLALRLVRDGERWWTCRRSLRPGSGCSLPGTVARPTPSTPTRSPPSRCRGPWPETN